MQTILLVLACVPSVLCVVMWRRARRQTDALREHGRLQLAQLERVQQAQELGHWFVWWVRNAAEPWPKSDPQRTHQLRFAVAAMLAGDVPSFISAMHSVSENAAKPQIERAAAANFIGEWQLAQRTGEVPWQRYVREQAAANKSTELYSAYRMDQLMRDAVHSWAALLGEHEIMAEASRNCPEHAAAHH